MNQIRRVLFLLVFPAVLHAGPNVVDSKQYQQEGSSLLIFSGSVDLPSRGLWAVDTEKAPEGFESLNLVTPMEARRRPKGRHMVALELERTIQRGRYPLHSLISACREYAMNNENRGPAVVVDLDGKKYSNLFKSLNSSPWRLNEKEKARGPFFYLIPNVQFTFVDNEKRVRGENRELLAFALRPYVGDGKHWVAYTDGTHERVEIDEKLLAKHGQTILPVFEDAPSSENLPPLFTYAVVATSDDTNSVGLVSVSLVNSLTDETMDIAWDLASAAPGDAALLVRLRDIQKSDWWTYLGASGSPVLSTWLSMDGRTIGGRSRRRGENTSVFGVMGGYAAVSETLQMQLLSSDKDPGERKVPIDSIEGVKVKSHPYEEMLGEQAPPRVALAERVPPDRFFVHLAKPEAMLPLLDNGADFISELGATLTGNSIKYYLKARYLKRLGANEEWLKAILLSGGIKECALMAPDLFFLDGTEITVISRVANPAVVTPMLKLLGVADLSGGDIVEKTNSDGSPVYWAGRGDLLIISTSEAEAGRVLDLDAFGGEGSLGKSAEFRYMLTQLPMNSQTRGYAYCSDPFIRRLVGPSVKIGQLRRVEAMNRMKQLTSAALLAQHDGFGRVQSLEILKTKGYLPESFPVAGLSLDADLVAHSDTYGTLANLNSISSFPVEMATEVEAKRYGDYVRSYSRFWRQFFDPIALRLDDKADQSLEATVFILPLIDSSVYNGIKQFVMAREDGVPLKTPRLSPNPVLSFSANLKETAWRSVSKTLSDILSRHIRANPTLVDDLGPSVHLFVTDANPVISLGSGDVLGGFGGNGLGIGGNNEMMLIPFVASMLTRPCVLAVETSNPEKTIRHLRSAAVSMAGERNGEFRSEIYQIEDRDSWVCLFDIMGAVKLRYGLEVRDGFLMIRNIPWSSEEKVTSVENASLNGMGLKVYPAACQLQLPGLHSTALEKSRTAALQGMGHLFPLLSCGYSTMDNVCDAHMKLFGFSPFRTADDEWKWEDDVIKSDRYGSIYQKRQPAYTKGDEGFGLLGAIQELSMETQFEDTGLRAKIKWKARD